MDAPWALTPLTVMKSRFESNSQRTAPSFVEYARRAPSLDPEKIAPGISVSAADCAPLQPRSEPHFGAGGGATQTRWPVASDTACRPPGFGCRMSDTAKYAQGAVCRRAPLDAAEHAAFACPVLPDDLAVPVGIERPADTGLLADDNQIAAARKCCEDRRAAEVEIRSVGLGTIWIRRAAAIGDVDVAGRRLLRPANRTGFQIDGDDRIARRLRRSAVGVAGRDVDQSTLRVDGRRRPDGRARRAEERDAGRTLVHAARACRRPCRSSR